MIIAVSCQNGFDVQQCADEVVITSHCGFQRSYSLPPFKGRLIRHNPGCCAYVEVPQTTLSSWVADNGHRFHRSGGGFWDCSGLALSIKMNDN